MIAVLLLLLVENAFQHAYTEHVKTLRKHKQMVNFKHRHYFKYVTFSCRRFTDKARHLSTFKSVSVCIEGFSAAR